VFVFAYSGVALVRGMSNKRNLTRHGYLTIIALTLETVLVFVVMILSFLTTVPAILALAPLSAVDTWLHVGLGALRKLLALHMWSCGFGFHVLKCDALKRKNT
jgi:uncharacterized membrane protein